MMDLILIFFVLIFRKINKGMNKLIIDSRGIIIKSPFKCSSVKHSCVKLDLIYLTPFISEHANDEANTLSNMGPKKKNNPTKFNSLLF